MSLSTEIVSEEKGSFGNATFTPKPRKPYVISKQRERWAEEEHAKFLEALQLHRRDWRKIEEYIGTKTSVQIRSHAQKYFSKVSRGIAMSEVDIPPPRPKRKPIHPYPRKQVLPCGREIQIYRQSSSQSKESSPLSSLPTSTVSDEEESSPTSVLSPLRSGKPAGRKEERENQIGGEEDKNISTGGLKSDGKMTESTSGKKGEPIFKAEDSKGPVKTMKLFGQTVIVTESVEKAPENVDGGSMMCPLGAGFLPPLCYIPPYGGGDNSAVAAGMTPVVCRWSRYSNTLFTAVSKDLPRVNTQRTERGGTEHDRGSWDSLRIW